MTNPETSRSINIIAQNSVTEPTYPVRNEAGDLSRDISSKHNKNRVLRIGGLSAFVGALTLTGSFPWMKQDENSQSFLTNDQSYPPIQTIHESSQPRSNFQILGNGNIVIFESPSSVNRADNPYSEDQPQELSVGNSEISQTIFENKQPEEDPIAPDSNSDSIKEYETGLETDEQSTDDARLSLLDSASTEKPNIVVIYMDDFSPDADWLWCNKSRTPALAKFCNQGVEFKNSTASTPRCCPARANVYTGLWSHNNHVTENDAGPFNPRQSVAIKLQREGYQTIHVGKFLNRFPYYASTQQSVFKYAKGWSKFDVLWTNHGKFYDYRLWTRSGVEKHGDSPRDHSSYVIAERVTRHIRSADRRKPVFAFVPLYDGHNPNLPMPRFIGDPKCQNVRPFDAPSYNEEDVSDKPMYVRERPLLPQKSFDLQTRCEEILTVDWVVSKIRRSLSETGRLKNTLLIFTADNGYLMGTHRLLSKSTPYSTPVPFYVLWPKRLGNVGRVVEEPISNVDLAPTFCAIAGCSIRRDGKSLIPLITGRRDQLNRLFVYEENLHSSEKHPAWYGLRTTKLYSNDAYWAYTEYSTDERELYNLTDDPWQLENLAERPGYEDQVGKLHRMLHDNVIEPNNVKFIPN